MTSSNKFVRSPLFYVGDKFKLLPQITKHYPEDLTRFIEVFTGGGSVFLNSPANEVYINDIDPHLMQIHSMLINYGANAQKLISDLKEIIKEYGLTDSSESYVIPEEIKKAFPKTYFAQINREPYKRLKQKFNFDTRKNYLELYVLLIYGFNRMLRFNKNGEFNIPVGNVDFNGNVVRSLKAYSLNTSNMKIHLHNSDFRKFVSDVNPIEGDFVYFDPPYLITASEYNKLWSEKDDFELYSLIDGLHDRDVKFMLSNVMEYNGLTNEILKNWARKYEVVEVESNYINYFNNSKKNIREVLIKNYV
jgi:DNA adenine methylase